VQKVHILLHNICTIFLTSFVQICVHILSVVAPNTTHHKTNQYYFKSIGVEANKRDIPKIYNLNWLSKYMYRIWGTHAF